MTFPLDFTLDSGTHVVVTHLMNSSFEFAFTFPDGETDQMIYHQKMKPDDIGRHGGPLKQHEHEALMVFWRLQEQ